MDIEKEETKILAINANGFPSKRSNKHKLKQLNNMLQNTDILISLETGINQENNPHNVSDLHVFAEINR